MEDVNPKLAEFLTKMAKNDTDAVAILITEFAATKAMLATVLDLLKAMATQFDFSPEEIERVTRQAFEKNQAQAQASSKEMLKSLREREGRKV